MAKKERNIIEVAEKEKGGKKIGVDSKGKLIEVKATPKEGAKTKRIIAVLLLYHYPDIQSIKPA